MQQTVELTFGAEQFQAEETARVRLDAERPVVGRQPQAPLTARKTPAAILILWAGDRSILKAGVPTDESSCPLPRVGTGYNRDERTGETIRHSFERNSMAEIFKIPLVLTPQPEGGFTVTSPVLPELVTEGDTLEDAVDNVRDALEAVIEIYEDLKRPLPPNLRQDPSESPIWFEGVVTRR